MAEFKVSVSMPSVMSAKPEIAGKLIPLLGQAVNVVAQQTVIDWQQAVYRAKLWSGEKDPYMKSIQMKMTGAFSAIVWSDYKYAEEIETGRPPRDLKKMLDTSQKVRISKKGKRYLIIPFRHGTPGSDALAPAMPANVYDLAKEMTPSRITGQTTRMSGTGAFSTKTRQRLTVPQNVYKWGGSLPAGLQPKAKASHATDIYAGMRRFDTSTPGGKSHSTFLTFRVMVEGSQGWVIQAQPGQFIAKKVADEMQPLAEEAFGEAIKRTLG